MVRDAAAEWVPDDPSGLAAIAAHSVIGDQNGEWLFHDPSGDDHHFMRSLPGYSNKPLVVGFRQVLLGAVSEQYGPLLATLSLSTVVVVAVEASGCMLGEYSPLFLVEYPRVSLRVSDTTATASVDWVYPFDRVVMLDETGATVACSSREFKVRLELGRQILIHKNRPNTTAKG